MIRSGCIACLLFGTAWTGGVAAAVTPIHTVQGSGDQSALVGESVTVEGVVTARLEDGFFVQAPDGAADTDASTSEGIFVSTGPTPPAIAFEGNLVRVSGTVEEVRDPGYSEGPTRTQISYANMLLVAPTQALPSQRQMLPGNIEPPFSFPGFMEALEGMRVVLPAGFLVSSPTDGRFSAVTGDVTGNGVLYGALRMPTRRPPGLPYGVPDPSGLIPHRPQHPERIRIDSVARPGAAPIILDANDSMTNVSGVLDQRLGARELFVDPAISPIFHFGSQARPLAAVAGYEASIASVVLEPFYDDQFDAAQPRPVMTKAAFESRAGRLGDALYAEQLAADVIAVTGTENGAVLDQVAARLNERVAQSVIRSTRHFVGLHSDLTDASGLGLGYLIDVGPTADGNARTQVVDISDIGAQARLAHPDGGDSALFERPPLLLRVVVNPVDAKTPGVPLSVLAVSLTPDTGSASVETGIRGWPDRGAEVRARRAAQALWLAGYIEARQIAVPTENLVVTGDFQSSSVVDGMVDVMGILAGTPRQDVLLPVSSPISRPLVALDDALPVAEAYDRVVEGEQVLHSHFLASAPMAAAAVVRRVELGRLNADWAVENAADPALQPLRTGRVDPIRLAFSTAALERADLYVTDMSLQNRFHSPDVAQPLKFDFNVGSVGPGPGRNWSLDIHLSQPVAFELENGANWTCSPVEVSSHDASSHCVATLLPEPQTQQESGFSVRFTTAVGDTTGYELTARVQSDSFDPDTSNNTRVGRAMPIVGGDLSVFFQLPRGTLELGSPVGIPLTLVNFGPGAAEATTLDLSVNVDHGVTVFPGSFFDCAAPVATGGGSTVHCTRSSFPADNFAEVSLSVVADESLPVEGLQVHAVVATASTDPESRNNTADALFTIAAHSNLCVSTDTVSCGLPPSTGVPFRLLPAMPATIPFGVRNLGTDVAINSRVDIYSTVAASRLSARIRGGAACSPAITEFEFSRITCQVGVLAANGPGLFVDATVSALGLTGGSTVVVTAVVSSNSSDPEYSNDVSHAVMPVATLVDLSAQVVAPKAALLPGVASDFVVIANAVGPATDAVSLMTLDITGDFEFLRGVELVTPGWVCGYMRIAPPDLRARCTRLVPLAPGQQDVLRVRTTPQFKQVGKSIRVMATHHYLPISSAYDSTSANDSASQTVAVGGRSTATGTVTKPAVELPPLPRAPTLKRVGLPPPAVPLPVCIDGAADIALINADGTPVAKSGCRGPRPN